MSSSKLNPSPPLWLGLVGLGIVIAILIYAWNRLPPMATGWSWKPYVAEIDYSVGDGPVQTLRLVGKSVDTSPQIDFDPGKKVRVHKARYGLFPSCYRMGTRVLQFENFGDLPRPESHPRIRLRAAIRKHWGSRPREEWYDEEGTRVSDWLNVDAQVSEVAWRPEWDLEKDWDMLRLQVEVEGGGPEESADVPVMLRPSDGKAQWDIRHNIFNTLLVEVGIGPLLLIILAGSVLITLVLSRRRHVRGMGP